jgi:uncharacterized membrane protein
MRKSPGRVAAWLLAGLSTVALVQNAWYWTQLPARVATHFDAQGRANAWMSKDTAIGLMIAFQVGVPLLLVGVASLTALVPNSLISLPNREFWLAPERRSETLATVRGSLIWIACALSAFTMFCSHLTFLANRNAGQLPVGWMWLALALFNAVILGLVARLFWRFRLPQASRPLR